MQMIRSVSAAQSRSKTDPTRQSGVEQDSSYAEGLLLNSTSERADPRTDAERQYMLMSDVHDRIREQFLKPDSLAGH